MTATSYSEHPVTAQRSNTGILQLPVRLQRDLALLIAVKLAMLALLWWLFFSPAHQPVIDMAGHIGVP